jgi:hypothetical protein
MCVLRGEYSISKYKEKLVVNSRKDVKKGMREMGGQRL